MMGVSFIQRRVMSKEALKFAWNKVAVPCLSAYMGVVCVMAMTLAVAEPTWKTWVGWGIILALPVVAFIVVYIRANKKD